jgi:hypothetical protein
MIKFFRQIRKSLFLENPPERKNRAGKTGSSTEAPAKVGKYLKYAIGEIVLVVIGILIALQINNWNQKRLSRIDEKNILSALHNEFLENKIKLDSVTIIYESGLNANMVLMDLIGKSAEELQEYDLDSLFYASLPDSQIIFSNNTVKNIVQTGKQDIIENSEIVQLINQWEATTVLIKEREQTLKVWIDNHLFPLLNYYVAFKEIDHNRCRGDQENESETRGYHLGESRRPRRRGFGYLCPDHPGDTPPISRHGDRSLDP